MAPEEEQELAELIAEDEAIEAAVREAVREALREHKRAGNPVGAWKNGQAVWVQPDQIDADW